MTFNSKEMTDAGVKRLILVSALEAEMQGMIAENKQREIEDKSMAYTDESFATLAEQMREIAYKHDEQL